MVRIIDTHHIKWAISYGPYQKLIITYFSDTRPLLGHIIHRSYFDEIRNFDQLKINRSYLVGWVKTEFGISS